jgi:hypothetical protein
MKLAVSGFLSFLILVFASNTAHADELVFNITNFDGLGSSATFFRPSTLVYLQPVETNGPHFVIGGDLYLTYAPGATVPGILNPFSSIGGDFITPTVFQTDHVADFGFEGDTVRAGFHVELDENGFAVEGTEFFDVGAPAGSPPLFTSTLYDESTGLPNCNPHLAQLCYGYATFQTGTFGNITITDITPEPASLLLLGTGLLGFVGARVRKNRLARA